MNDFLEIGRICEIYEFELSALIKLLIASVCGGLIGLEREMKGRPAGLKTFSLVCIGSTLVMITNAYVSLNISGVLAIPHVWPHRLLVVLDFWELVQSW